MEFSGILELAIKAAFKAGNAIMKIYNSNNFNIEFKNDNSPLTEADKISHDIIKSILNSTEIPLLSEEGLNIPYKKRKNWNKLWVVDPIDGTKEFINRNGEFTVNIALIEDQKPVLGVVYAPALMDLYFAESEMGSYKVENVKTFHQIKNSHIIDLKKSEYPKVYTFVVSKSHMNDETQNFLDFKEKEKGKISTTPYGSSLKICKVAEGSAHCYPRFGPTMEWDTAAAHAVALYANTKVFQYETNSQLIYNKKKLLNPSFIVYKEQ